MGIAQKIVNAGIGVSSLVLAYTMATHEMPSLENVFGDNNGTATSVAQLPEYPKRLICVTDSFKEACATELGEALDKFQHNARMLSREEKQRRHNDDEKSRKSLGRNAQVSDAVYVEQRSSNGTIHAGRQYEVPLEYAKILRQATKGSPLTFDIMVQIIGSESGFNSKAVSDTNAVGMGQFTGATLRQVLWDNKEKLSRRVRGVIEQNIELHNIADKDEAPDYRYEIKKGGSKKALNNLAKDPEVSIILACAYAEDAMQDGEKRFRTAVAKRIDYLQRHPEKNTDHARMARLNDQLHRKLNATDIKIMYMAGPRGGAKILAAYADSKNMAQRATDHTADIVHKGNPDVFYKDDDKKQPRSVRDVYRYFVDRVGTYPVARAARIPSPSQGLNIG